MNDKVVGGNSIQCPYGGSGILTTIVYENDEIKYECSLGLYSESALEKMGSSICPKPRTCRYQESLIEYMRRKGTLISLKI